MDATVSCPECRRRFRISEAVIGKKAKCSSCGAVFVARAEAPAAVGDRDEASAIASGPWPEEAQGGAGGKPRPQGFGVAIKQDPARLLKGIYQGQLSARGLLLRRARPEQVIRIPVGTPVQDLGKGRIAVRLDGRDVTMAVGRLNLYSQRLARDLVSFLGGGGARPTLADYAIPWYLLGAAFLPAGVAFACLGGGAIGGGLGGGYAGGLVGANLVIVRQEKWPLAGRLAACLAVSAIGYAVFIVAVMALLGGLPRAGANPAAPPPVAAPSFPVPVAPSVPVPQTGVAPAPTPRLPAGPPRTPPPATELSGLAGYWPCDEGTGANAADLSGNGHDGSLTKGRWVDGIRGRAVRFDGDGFLDYGDSPGFNFGHDEPFTFAGWVRSPEGVGVLFSQRNAERGSPVIDIELGNRTVAATVRDDSFEAAPYAKLSGADVRDDGWHHFALVRRSGNRIGLYLDGELQREVTGASSGGPITTTLRSAGAERYWAKNGGGGTPYLRGALDELCIFKRDLDPAEIRRLAGRP